MSEEINDLNSNPVNVIYLTTDCNFACEYCYENQKFCNVHKHATNEEIENFVDNIVRQTNPEINNYTVCLMGGEPFLAAEQMDYFMEYIKKYTAAKTFCPNVVTNGSLVHKYIDDIKRWRSQYNVFFGLDISYDGSFQYKRTKTDIVERNMHLLKDNNITFGISYTIGKDSLKDKMYLKDIVNLIKEYYTPIIDLNHQRFRININYGEFTKEEIDVFEEELRQECCYLYSKLGISFCYFACDACKKCVFNNTGKKYTIPGESDAVIERMVTHKKFNHF